MVYGKQNSKVKAFGRVFGNQIAKVGKRVTANRGINSLLKQMVGTYVKQAANKSYSNTGTQTGNKSRSKRSGYSGISKSAGFIRPRKRNIEPNDNRILRLGTSATTEVGQVISTKELAMIGHGTFAKDILEDQFWISLLKLLFTKIGYPVNDIDDTLPFSISQDLFSIGYFPTDASVSVTTVFPIVLDNRLRAIATAFSTATELFSPGVRLQYIQFQPDLASVPTGELNYARVWLSDMKIEFTVKSDLKMQNRSIGSTGNDTTDEVDNVPLYGKSYYGKGTYLVPARSNQFGSVLPTIDNSNGIFTQNSSGNPFNEPLQGGAFKNITKIGKVHIDPGEIKTSSLIDKMTFNLTDFWLEIRTQGLIRKATGKGKFCFMYIEKMIDTSAAAPNLIIALEHNYRVGCVCKEVKRFTTMPTMNKIYLP